MWYCEVLFASGNKSEIPFKNEEEAKSFFEMKIESDEVFLKVGYNEDKINLSNIELIKKPTKMKDVWEVEQK